MNRICMTRRKSLEQPVDVANFWQREAQDAGDAAELLSREQSPCRKPVDSCHAPMLESWSASVSCLFIAWTGLKLLAADMLRRENLAAGALAGILDWLPQNRCVGIMLHMHWKDYNTWEQQLDCGTLDLM